MPHLRFTRDRRGYENTFLVHRDRSQRSDRGPSILYWFRTPPDIRVGRTALDEQAIRALEAEHPDVEFDWPRILEAVPPEAAARSRTSRDPGGPDASHGSERRARRAKRRPPAGDERAAPSPRQRTTGAAGADSPGQGSVPASAAELAEPSADVIPEPE